jgi:hypothetical protein
MAETDSPKLQKLRRKLSELQKQGAKEEVERLQRKIAKLERECCASILLLQPRGRSQGQEYASLRQHVLSLLSSELCS